MTERTRVHFHEASDPGWYHVTFDNCDTLVYDALVETLEGKLGAMYERAVDPGESVYVGDLVYDEDAVELTEHSDVVIPDDAWTFERIPADELGVPLDGETYLEETTTPVPEE